jgi:hypothetical protein
MPTASAACLVFLCEPAQQMKAGPRGSAIGTSERCDEGVTLNGQPRFETSSAARQREGFPDRQLRHEALQRAGLPDDMVEPALGVMPKNADKLVVVFGLENQLPADQRGFRAAAQQFVALGRQ